MKFYADEYTLSEYNIPLDECENEGITERTSAEVFSVKAKYRAILRAQGVKSLRLVGYDFGCGLFTEGEQNGNKKF